MAGASARNVTRALFAGDIALARRQYRQTVAWRSFLLATLMWSAGASVFDVAEAACSISSNYNGTYVAVVGTSCAIDPGTSLGASPYPSPTSISADAAQITANGVTASFMNGQGIGAQARNGGIVTLGVDPLFGGSTINLGINGGGQNVGVIADGANSQIIATGLAVNLGGAGNNVGAQATNGGTVTLNNGSSINFLPGGGGNTGLWASGTNSQVITNDAIVRLPSSGGAGGNDTGVRADTGAAATLNGGLISVTGNGGGENGLLATGSGSNIAGHGMTIDVSSGGNARGGVLMNGASIALTDSRVTTTGTGGSFGFLLQAATGVTNGLSLDRTFVTSTFDALVVQGGGASIDTVGSVVTSNNGILLSASQSAAVTMTNRGSDLTGAIFTDSSSTTNVSLSAQTVWTMTASSNVTNLANNDSNIVFTAPSGNAFKTLTVTNYAGSGGTITLNTYLGGDNSPSDRLVVNGGTATGSTRLRIQNTNGPGAETVADGILVVSTTDGGTTAAGAFSLAGEVRGGAYDYFLYRGGLNGGSANDWFLRSTFEVQPPIPTPEPPEEIIPPPVLPADPPPTTLPPGVYPIIGPEVATYGVIQPVARQLGLATLGTLNQRIGDTMTPANAAGASTGWGRPDWGRFFGQQVDNHYRAFADPRTSGWLAGFQGGVDLWRGSSLPGHRDAAGVYLAYSRAGTNVDGLITNPAATAYVLTHTGAFNLDAYSAAAYWTHYGPAGWYFDAILQGTLYRGSATTEFAQLPTKGSGIIASLEAGYPIPLPLGPRFVIEPQAQLIWQRVSFADANDGLGLVAPGSTSGPTGRLGVRGRWTIEASNGIVWQPYAGINYWKTWSTLSATTFSGTDEALLVENAERVDAFAGVTSRLNSQLSLYAQGGYQFTLRQNIAGSRPGAQGNIGLRYNW
ncbi:autotransporter outer membrane beta-barrel domain-containing protein [Bradyrhizobium manausense]|uniref:autotransporter family protein n=1 Tax=Bradyrhizobium TaxID=374 RepID=UPI001BAD673D|nr:MULTISPECIES: autotransporter outer membrane beta-barrel domain-containing protein [Bradyrhizobium]MBR0828151.1 autotransporter outer membrane beta-barrel domain-containing protein [Bradyrhizobium manausense]UVO33006.1 autotransporter outer membrane beta-barrel domain-containing protein [Bradyrhizobium arachidis]